MAMTFLYIDDDPDDRDIFKEAINKLDPSCRYLDASCGSQALQILETTSPDYIFLDVNMPGTNGEQTLREIRSRTALSEIPVIMFSTSMSDGDSKKYLDGGANFCMAKPNSFEELCDQLKQFFDSK